MVLFTILVIMTIVLGVITVLTVATGGAAFILVFSDVIVCVALIIWLIKKMFGKNK